MWGWDCGEEELRVDVYIVLNSVGEKAQGRGI